AGLNVTLSVGGITVINDLPLAWFGTTGSMDLSAHVAASQVLNGGRVELYLRETVAQAAMTCDYQLLFEPM
ncbi:unnamed protein product, partial [marine sediment metagenome]